MMGRGSVLKKMQNYEPELCQRLGNAIYSAMEMAWKKRGQAELMTMEVVEKSTEEMQYLEQNKELIKIGGHEILKSVANLHRQLGHPNGAKLVLAVKARHLPNEFVQVARRYKCPTCLARAQPKNVRVATLHKSPHFNHSVAIDTFYVEWDGKQRAVFTIMDEFSRYEVDMEIKEETADMEIALFESTWSRSFGFPKVLRLDASGPHQGQQFADWASAHGMYMDLIPRGAHHRLGILERNHAVRRRMLEIFHKDMPELDFEQAILVTCHQRNRLSSVKGATPATLAFGYVPSEGGNADDPGPEQFGDSADLAQVMEVKQKAAQAFHSANFDLAVRSAALARSRVDEDELMVGDYVYYWKPQTHKLDPFRWRGPAMVVSVEASIDRKTMIYWIVHGSSLVRATRQQLRFETVPERYERQSKPAYLESVQKPLQQRLLEALKPVRGPVRAIDIAGKAQSPDDFPQLGGTGAAAVAPGDAPPHEPHEPPDPPKTDDKSKSKTATAELDTPGKPADKSKARPKAKLPEPRIDFWVDYPDSEKTESESKTTDKTLLDEMVANKDKNLDDHTQGMTDIQKEMKRKLEEEHPGIMDSSHGVIDRQDDEPPVNPDDVSVRARDRRFYEQAVRAASFLSHENNRRLDGLPPSGRQLPASAAAQASRPAANLVPSRADDG